MWEQHAISRLAAKSQFNGVFSKSKFKLRSLQARFLAPEGWMNDPQVSSFHTVALLTRPNMPIGIIPTGRRFLSCWLPMSPSTRPVGQHFAVFGYVEGFYILD